MKLVHFFIVIKIWRKKICIFLPANRRTSGNWIRRAHFKKTTAKIYLWKHTAESLRTTDPKDACSVSETAIQSQSPPAYTVTDSPQKKHFAKQVLSKKQHLMQLTRLRHCQTRINAPFSSFRLRRCWADSVRWSVTTQAVKLLPHPLE